jgi:hypothetical protein
MTASFHSDLLCSLFFDLAASRNRHKQKEQSQYNRWQNDKDSASDLDPIPYGDSIVHASPPFSLDSMAFSSASAFRHNFRRLQMAIDSTKEVVNMPIRTIMSSSSSVFILFGSLG